MHMLYEFLLAHEDELIEGCRERVRSRRAPRASDAELTHGVPLFLHHLIDALRRQDEPVSAALTATASQHGRDLEKHGFSVGQVIHSYGDLCQTITALADEKGASITAGDFGRLNFCLDEAIASAVTEYSHRRETDVAAQRAIQANIELGSLAHELRNLLNTATLSYESIRQGHVPVNGSTSAVHDRALRGLRLLIDRSLVEVRLGGDAQSERIHLGSFIEEVEIGAVLEANAFAIQFVVDPVDRYLFIRGDRPILAAAMTNLLQNAFKFTLDTPGAQVTLRAFQEGDSVVMEVEDGCGGLPVDRAADLFAPFVQENANKSGLGLGLSIAKRGVEANGGTLTVKDLPGRGCVFSIRLPLEPMGISIVK